MKSNVHIINDLNQKLENRKHLLSFHFEEFKKNCSTLNINFNNNKTKTKRDSPNILLGYYNSPTTFDKSTYINSDVILLDLDKFVTITFDDLNVRLQQLGIKYILWKTLSCTDVDFRYKIMLQLNKCFTLNCLKSIVGILVESLNLNPKSVDLSASFPYKANMIPHNLAENSYRENLSGKNFVVNDIDRVTYISYQQTKSFYVDTDQLVAEQQASLRYFLYALKIDSNYGIWSTTINSISSLFYDLPEKLVIEEIICWSKTGEGYDADSDERIKSLVQHNRGWSFTEKIKSVNKLEKTKNFVGRKAKIRHIKTTLTNFIALHTLIYVRCNSTFIGRSCNQTYTLDFISKVYNKYYKEQFPYKCCTELTYAPELTAGSKVFSEEYKKDFYNLFSMPNSTLDHDSKSYNIQGATVLINHLLKLLHCKTLLDYEGASVRDLEILPKNVKYLIYFLAYKLQQPSKRLFLTPIICSIQGVGKSIIFKHLLERLFGDNNIRKLTMSKFSSQFTDPFYRKILVVLEEFEMGRNIYSDIKDLITSDSIEHNLKHKNMVSETNYVSFLGFCNKDAKIHIVENERRFYFMESSVTQENLATDFGENYFENLVENFKQYHLDIYKWLIDLDIPKWVFDLKIPPREDIFYQFVEDSEPNILKVLRTFFDNFTVVFNQNDIFTFKNLKNALTISDLIHPSKLNQQTLGRQLKVLGYYSTRIYSKGVRDTFYYSNECNIKNLLEDYTKLLTEY